MTLKSDAKFEEKLTLGSKKGIKNLMNFNVSSGKSENLHFDVLLLSIAYKVSAKKVTKNYLSWHWRVIQTYNKNWLSVWKITWRVLVNLMPAVESLKICTLMGYFCRKYIIFKLKKYIGIVHYLSEVFPIPHVIFETRSQFLYKHCTIALWIFNHKIWRWLYSLYDLQFF